MEQAVAAFRAAGNALADDETASFEMDGRRRPAGGRRLMHVAGKLAGLDLVPEFDPGFEQAVIGRIDEVLP